VRREREAQRGDDGKQEAAHGQAAWRLR
jgi:hypothetical protein